MKKNRKMNNRGFTLVELIVVIAIIGILVAIAVPKFGSTLDSAKEKADLATARAVTSAVLLYYADNGDYPYTNGTTISSTNYSKIQNYIDSIELQQSGKSLYYNDGVVTVK